MLFFLDGRSLLISMLCRHNDLDWRSDDKFTLQNEIALSLLKMPPKPLVLPSYAQPDDRDLDSLVKLTWEAKGIQTKQRVGSAWV